MTRVEEPSGECIQGEDACTAVPFNHPSPFTTLSRERFPLFPWLIIGQIRQSGLRLGLPNTSERQRAKQYMETVSRQREGEGEGAALWLVEGLPSGLVIENHDSYLLRLREIIFLENLSNTIVSQKPHKSVFEVHINQHFQFY